MHFIFSFEDSDNQTLLIEARLSNRSANVMWVSFDVHDDFVGNRLLIDQQPISQKINPYRTDIDWTPISSNHIPMDFVQDKTLV